MLDEEPLPGSASTHQHPRAGQLAAQEHELEIALRELTPEREGRAGFCALAARAREAARGPALADGPDDRDIAAASAAGGSARAACSSWRGVAPAATAISAIVRPETAESGRVSVMSSSLA